jgi:hypothetical protein
MSSDTARRRPALGRLCRLLVALRLRTPGPVARWSSAQHSDKMRGGKVR